METGQQRYLLNRAVFRNLREFESYLDGLWTDAEFRSRVDKAGIDRGLLPERRRSAITVSSEAAALDPSTVEIIVAFAAPAAKITIDVWNLVVVPWLEQRKGAGTLKVPRKKAPSRKKTVGKTKK